MHVITHLLAGWTLADECRLEGRDRALVTWASVAPDLDGLGLFADVASSLLGRPVPGWYEAYHHWLAHGLPGAIVITAVLACVAARRVWTALFVFLSVHLHLAMDMLGSRGSEPDAYWPVHYLAPISDAMTLHWSGQWPLTGWQNTSITAALMLFAMYRATQRGYSPVGLFSHRADLMFVATLRNRFPRA